MSEFLLVNKATYARLLRKTAILEWLESKGVDNWEGYSTPPEREDYDTDEEYEVAFQKALYDY